MKTLIIHPEDYTTNFLASIYTHIKNKTVVDGNVTKAELLLLIESHERVIMLGHGTLLGLYNTGTFPESGLLIIDDTMVNSLREKKDTLFIWCNADQFVRRHELTGFCCGMFISEVREANTWGFKKVNWDLIIESNENFALIVSKYINGTIDFLFQRVFKEYSLIARNNPIAKFNLVRLYLISKGFENYPKEYCKNFLSISGI